MKIDPSLRKSRMPWWRSTSALSAALRAFNRSSGCVDSTSAPPASRAGYGCMLRRLGADRRDPEVEELHARQILVGEEEVSGLEIAMHDAASMELTEAAGDRASEREALAGGQTLAREPFAQRLAFEP